MAEGTRSLHQAGKLHRDIKPANVLVRPDGRVVLLDFGLVYPLALAPHEEAGADGTDPRRASRWADLSDQGTVAGTVAYMSPEQAAAAPLTPASDWYAVGVMLYQALTGRLPFAGTPLEVLRAKQARDGPAPADLLPGVPEDLNELCRRLLRRDPGGRPGGPEDPRRPRRRPGPGGRRSGRTPAVRRPREAPGRVGAGVRAGVVRPDGRLQRPRPLRRRQERRLVQHFLDGVAARGEAVILTGRCYEQESVPYKAVDSLVDAVTRFLLHLDPAEVAGAAPAGRRAADPHLPGPDAHRGGGRGDPRRGRGQRPAAAAGPRLRALRELLTRIAARWPLIAWVDDLQWGDVDGAALLSHVLRPPGARGSCCCSPTAASTSA